MASSSFGGTDVFIPAALADISRGAGRVYHRRRARVAAIALAAGRGIMNNSALAMGLRRAQRVKAVLPVRVWGTDAAGKEFIAMAHTLDVSRTGARIAGVAAAMRVGDNVGLQYRNVR